MSKTELSRRVGVKLRVCEEQAEPLLGASHSSMSLWPHSVDGCTESERSSELSELSGLFFSAP